MKKVLLSLMIMMLILLAGSALSEKTITGTFNIGTDPDHPVLSVYMDSANEDLILHTGLPECFDIGIPYINCVDYYQSFLWLISGNITSSIHEKLEQLAQFPFVQHGEETGCFIGDLIGITKQRQYYLFSLSDLIVALDMNGMQSDHTETETDAKVIRSVLMDKARKSDLDILAHWYPVENCISVTFTEYDKTVMTVSTAMQNDTTLIVFGYSDHGKTYYNEYRISKTTGKTLSVAFTLFADDKQTGYRELSYGNRIMSGNVFLDITEGNLSAPEKIGITAEYRPADNDIGIFRIEGEYVCYDQLLELIEANIVYGEYRSLIGKLDLQITYNQEVRDNGNDLYDNEIQYINSTEFDEKTSAYLESHSMEMLEILLGLPPEVMLMFIH